MTEIRRLPIPRCLLAEGPVWDARRNRLIVTDINGKRLHLLDWAAQRTHTLALPQKAGFAALCEDGLALGMEDGAYFLPEECLAEEAIGMEALSPLHAPQAIPGARFNDGKPGPDGRLYGGTLCREGRGRLLRIAGGRMETALAPVSISNGLAWAADGRTMYYCYTYTHQVDALDFDEQTGELSNRRPAVDFHDLRAGAPDGLCIDREGRLWVAAWGEGAVYRCDPKTGEKVRAAELPGASHASCTAFAGENLDTLVVTTGLVEGEESSGYTYALKPGARGTLPFLFTRKEPRHE